MSPSELNKSLVIAHTECSKGWGGQEIRVFTEMQAFRRRGHHLLLCAPPHTTIYQKCAGDGFTVFPFTDAKAAYPKTIAQLAGFFRREQAQVVNTHSSRDSWLAGLAARLAGVPLLIRSRHIEVDYPNRFVSRIAYNTLPHHVITTSQKISGRLIQELQLPADKVTCVPTGIDLAKFRPRGEGALRAELKLPATTRLVGMISVLRSWKGHRYFLQAARHILDSQTNVHFVIGGEGDGRLEINLLMAEAKLQGHVTLLGHREDVPNVLASLDLLVVPSTAHEGIPQIVLQAQAMGKPIVGTAIGGIPEVVEEGKTGFVVPAKDGKALAQAIITLLNDAGLRKRFGEEALAKAQMTHGLDFMCDRLEALYARYLK